MKGTLNIVLKLNDFGKIMSKYIISEDRDKIIISQYLKPFDRFWGLFNDKCVK